MIQILCNDNSPVEIAISDSDGDFVSPTQTISVWDAARRRLKLCNSNGELTMCS